MANSSPTTSYIDTGSATIHVEETGAGEPALVFLHYWGGSARTWAQVIAPLANTARCVAIDHRGWGMSTAPSTGYATADLAADAMAVINALDLDRYIIVGHSMGGKVAQLIACSRPEGLCGLVLVAPAPAKPLPVSDEFLTLLKSAYDTRESVIAGMNGAIHKPLSDDLREQVIHDSLAGAPEAKHAWPEHTISEDVSENLSQIDVPVLVLVGDCDKVEPEEVLRSQVVAHIRTAALEVVRGSGHFMPLEKPAELTNRIVAFRASLAAVKV